MTIDKTTAEARLLTPDEARRALWHDMRAEGFDPIHNLCRAQDAKTARVLTATPSGQK